MAEHVHKRHPDALFVLVGEGPMEAELDEMIKSANLQDIIRLAGVWTNIWEVYPAFDVLAQTSRVEGMPFVLLEAMAYGRPVVAMAVGGVAEIIEVGSTGFVSANGDWAGLGDALIKLLAKPEQSKQMGQGARRRVEELYDLRTSIRLLVNLFCRLVGRPVPAEEILHPNWPVARQEQEAAVLNPNAAFPQDR
jgi:glycosyltransferase involved in cell wall biosynthesis